ncbi:MAG: hypothetical protein A2509_09370 [Candidatus Edwardsbacteria bacterium RIFOXYD12_FULL_50_11]|uniref:Inner membrane protein YgaP-like transmembrane domain-containing protein n=1 Tax=Candidatus Edwardsbacteria bacterium GWF2_54_11 TaxID=1817851 RepID=A0A1F5R5R5_9BACT|nr:MAG: hypothetical protein A2502_08500 [Candidatus Edwardsbacteria bacterium RifOxyC12_full_54_24]OGF07371.1 MAG: hypothetical protein A2273_02555 [Candidatus Edwardsbacteria bacterium RifOxyA12_full_54_48]OGF09363.1 MAG: hypothetical protein A2024_08755 [Candidatus Edwardsbacteria bacterium GWF2_54_11]OGF09623.1 MAG: hypothetical protein A3K15_08965 [Candidatus Edwardsbacteria bacterium GWE2_54_12]OGF18066.1 MAG: hypothetical protein A2509_09370 [Candidatus Edwardsbacteria bacterium RIFOXYD1
MKTNESVLDRIIRAVLGIALLAAGLLMAGPIKWVLLVLAAIALITAVTGFCLLYRVLGINTNKKTKE